MHGPIRDQLEDLLRAGTKSRDTAQHLAQCGECASQLEAMREHARQFASLQAPVTDPAAGFYARVMQRIEEQTNVSFWSFFAESAAIKRLALASLAMAIALGSYVVSEETAERHHQRSTSILAADGRPHYDAPVMGSQAEQREAVLENFAVHSGAEDQGRIQ